MTDLTFREKMNLEKLFGMASGYVLDFSNRTFQEFIFESLGINIYDEKYDFESGSKANLLRGLWINQSNHIAGKVIADLINHWKYLYKNNSPSIDSDHLGLHLTCKKISDRLIQGSPTEFLDALETGDEFELLSRTIRECIQRNEPETALDRLHTYTMKYIRSLCNKHGISYSQKTPLNGIFGSYVKNLESNNMLESEMTIRILKSTISIFDSFNKVRNEKSFAHDNPILNHDESVLIFNNILISLQFIQQLEEDDLHPPETETETLDKIPF